MHYIVRKIKQLGYYLNALRAVRHRASSAFMQSVFEIRCVTVAVITFCIRFTSRLVQLSRWIITWQSSRCTPQVVLIVYTYLIVLTCTCHSSFSQQVLCGIHVLSTFSTLSDDLFSTFSTFIVLMLSSLCDPSFGTLHQICCACRVPFCKTLFNPYMHGGALANFVS